MIAWMVGISLLHAWLRWGPQVRAAIKREAPPGGWHLNRGMLICRATTSRWPLYRKRAPASMQMPRGLQSMPSLPRGGHALHPAPCSWSGRRPDENVNPQRPKPLLTAGPGASGRPYSPLTNRRCTATCPRTHARNFESYPQTRGHEVIHMPATCFKCGQSGHVASDCAWEKELEDPRPMWCGTCDPRTRHVDLGDRVRRCECHPESHKLPGHMRRCPHCKVITVTWDTAECGRHHIAGQHPVYAGPPVIPDDEWQRRHAVSAPRADFPGGLPDPPEYPAPAP